MWAETAGMRLQLQWTIAQEWTGVKRSFKVVREFPWRMYMESKLFDPMTIRDITWKNRVMVSPMWQYCGINGFPTDWHLMNLGRFADGGAGLVFQEGTTVDPRGRGTLGDLAIWDDAYVEPLRRIASFVRENGAVPAIQLMHAGRKGRQRRPFEGRGPLERSAEIADFDSWHPIAPSPIAVDEVSPTPREMSLTVVQETVQSFADAAGRADRAGYDVLEIHGAHGYLLHQFLSSACNVRCDRYGGTTANRMRFVEEVVEAVRSQWPAGKPLFLRLSCIDGAGWSMEDTVTLVRRLMPLGVDLIDCSTGGLGNGPLVPDGQRVTYGYQVPYAAQLKRLTGVLTAAVGLIVHAEQAEGVIARGEADIVALAREMMYNPHWTIDAARKLGVEASFRVTQWRTAFWLDRRMATVPDLIPSTYEKLPVT
jgi:2,4-dienoyl-CoA reductase-like NADH-dependent reductase (Old Yellow Enzyme family)